MNNATDTVFHPNKSKHSNQEKHRPSLLSLATKNTSILFASRLLRKIGLRGTTYGFDYLSMALVLVVSDSRYLHALTTELYPELAKIFHVSEKNISCSIYRQIDSLWKRIGPEPLEELIGYKLSEKPYVGDFLDILSAYMHERNAARRRAGK